MPNRTVQPEHDACALAAVAARDARASARPLHRALHTLERMAHRAGGIGGEGDGCGVQVDIPRALWAQRLGSALPADERFAVAHLAGPDPEAALRATELELIALTE